MTKDLSRQLAELGNIPPVYKYQISFKQDDGELITFPVWGKEALTQHIKMIRPIVKVVKVDKLYPNFESPENFVKLLEVYLNTSNDYISFDTGFDKFECTAGGYTDKYGELYGEVMNYSESLEESTILTIIGYLKKEKTNKLKQALQSTEFKY